VETLAFGYGLAEAPQADREGNVYFSDVIGGGVHRWSLDGGVETVVPKRRGVGGLVLHADGGIVISGRSVQHVQGGESRTVLELDGVTGFNDMGTDANGRLYVGALRFMPFAGEDPVPGEVWRVAAGETPKLIFDGIDWPNGIGFAPDGQILYTCDYAHGEVVAHTIAHGDEAVERRTFARSPTGSADGLAVDVDGGVWVALGQGGAVARFGSDGSLDQILDVPASFVSSLCFGGADGRDLCITTGDNTEEPERRGTLFRTRTDFAGTPVAPATI
jgi:sugar lactone lactonase YvrE